MPGKSAVLYKGQATDRKARKRQKGPECEYVEEWIGQLMLALAGFDNDDTPFADLPAHKRLLVDACEVSTTCAMSMTVC
jgi:hypothetical protein